MKSSLCRVVPFLLLLWVFLISSSVDSLPAVNTTPDVEQFMSNHLVVHDQSALPVLYDEPSGLGPTATEGAGSGKLASQGGFNDWPLKVQDSSSAHVSAICSSVNEPGQFLLASLDGTVSSIDCKSGMKQWALETGSELSYSEWAISEVDDSGCFLYSGEDWYLYEYCMDKGFNKLNSTIEEYVHNTPKIRGPEVTIGSKVTTMFFLDADSGEQLHKEQFPSNQPANSDPKFGEKVVLPKIKSAIMTKNYIIIVRTDYYLNSSVLGKPLWNMMDSRISATRVNRGLPDKLGADVKMWPMHQEELPVYFPSKVNRAMLVSSISLMPPSASDNHKFLTIDAKNIYPESANMLPVIFDATKDHKSGSITDQNLQENLFFSHSGDSFKESNVCPSGTCILPKPSENKMFYKVASLQSCSNPLTKHPFELVSGVSECYSLTNSSAVYNNSDIEQLDTWKFESFSGFLQILLFLTLITCLALYFLKIHDPIKHEEHLTNKKKFFTSPKKKKARKAANTRSGSSTSSHDRIISSEKQNAETEGNFQSIDPKLVNLLSMANFTREGRLVGKLFVSNKEIGRGSNGTVVFEGIHDGRAVAVKRLLRSHHDAAFKEIQNLIASDQHPNIVRWYGVEQDLDFVYISLERCMSSLSDLIQLCTNCPTTLTVNDGVASDFLNENNIFPHMKDIDRGYKLWTSDGLPTSQLLKLMRDVVSGVAHLHELGIIHRDLKPQNVLVSDGRILAAKVSDMGISKRLLDDMSSISHHSTGCGSSGWRAPEQLQNGSQTRAVDLFSLGCILFFCITKGEHPFGKQYERDANIMNNRVDLFLIDHIPEAIDLLSKLLNPEPKMRPNAIDVLHHPFFWSSETRLTFLRDTSDRIELENRENESELLNALESAVPVAFGGKWGDKLDPAFVNDMGRYRKYNFDSIRDLLRLIRNKLNHYRELPNELKETLGPVPQGFDRYFSARFPRLLIEVYKVISIHCKEEDSFSKYFNSTPI